MKANYRAFWFIFLFLVPFSYADEGRVIGILLDVSRSVSPKEFERIKGQVQELMDQELQPVFSIYTFGNQLQKIDPNRLRSVQANESNTMFFDAVYDAMRDLIKAAPENKMILIFSDGRDTKSVTIPEDIVTFARDQKIVIHCIGTGNANRKLLERISKLTGGKFFPDQAPDLVSQIKMAIAVQKDSEVSGKPQPKNIERRAPPARSEIKHVEEPEGPSYLWIGIILGTALLAGIGVMVAKRRSGQVRFCPNCERPLEAHQTICPDCPGQTKILSVPELNTEVAEKSANKADPVFSLPRLELKEDTQEILSKTYFLVETPVLVVTKGNNVGESYQLSKDAPVSIGRSRLNEIRPDDGSISAQHCRIIPENGEFVLYDLGSTNGTIVNNIMVNKAVLETGDTIKVGATILLFTFQENRSPN